MEEEFRLETISYYEVANYLYKQGLYRALTMPEFRRYLTQGIALKKAAGGKKAETSETGLKTGM